MEEKIDRDHLVAIARHATTDVFGTMLGMEIEPLEAYAETEPPVAAAGILSLIGFRDFSPYSSRKYSVSAIISPFS